MVTAPCKCLRSRFTDRQRQKARRYKKQRCQKCCRGLGAGSEGQSCEDGQKISHVYLYPTCLHPKHGEAFNVWLRQKRPGDAPGRRRPPRGAGPRPAVLGPDAGSAFARVRRPAGSRKTRPRLHRRAANFHDNRGAHRARRTGVRDARCPPRRASGSRLRCVAAPPATYLARPGPRRPRPAAPPSARRVARPGPAAAAPPLSRQVVGSGPAPGAGPPAPAANPPPAPPPAPGTAAAALEAGATQPRPGPPLAAHAPRRARPETGSESSSWAPARPAVAGAVSPAGALGPAHRPGSGRFAPLWAPDASPRRTVPRRPLPGHAPLSARRMSAPSLMQVPATPGRS